ncbi:phosphate ABC transporter permease PstC [Cupriavidus necator]|uniref:phosphate ABC transporter permease PstC n=1 Tax=Cupriavidus necator TaxID=106590 RepID=UPI00278B2CE9|nr:phosphate ABC transporter permease PstC [Cupriavidus necator]MDQ0139284.1 phosphate transport system permease protein [Cupriavidus necator]
MATIPSDTRGVRPPSRLGDILFGGLTRGAAIVTLLLLGGIIVSLAISAWPSIETFGARFLWSAEWDPPADVYGALVPIYGTIVTSLIALIIAVPVSFGIALFLTELSPAWLRRPLGTAIELLAAVPSIVYGMWGLLVFAPIFGEYFQKPLAATVGQLPVVGKLFQGAPLGIGLLCAGVILAIMIIPYIASVMRDVFEVTPVLLKESAYGVGCTTWEVMWNVVLPYTRAGVIGGVMLGLGRALGETMAVTFVIGNTNLLDNASLFSPGNSITSALANEFAEAGAGLHTAALMELGLILFFITFVVLALSKLLLLRLAKNEGAK